MLGKVKTTAQMIAIPLLLYHVALFGLDTQKIGNWLIWIAALLTLWSMGYYPHGLAGRSPAGGDPG